MAVPRGGTSISIDALSWVPYGPSSKGFSDGRKGRFRIIVDGEVELERSGRSIETPTLRPTVPPQGADRKILSSNPHYQKKTRFAVKRYRVRNAYTLFRYDEETNDGVAVENASCECRKHDHQQVWVLGLGATQALPLAQECDTDGHAIR